MLAAVALGACLAACSAEKNLLKTGQQGAAGNAGLWPTAGIGGQTPSRAGTSGGIPNGPQSGLAFIR